MLRISEKCWSLECFNQDSTMEAWCVDKNWRLNTFPHNYTLKRAKISNGDDVIEMAMLTLSDLEKNNWWESWLSVSNDLFQKFYSKIFMLRQLFIHFKVCCYIVSFITIYILWCYILAGIQILISYDSDKILFYTYLFLKKINF